MQGVGALARRGRHRKKGNREPNGRLDRKDERLSESAVIIALRQPHRKEAPPTHADDRRAETPLGILNMIGAVSHAEFAAARRYARIVGRYRQVINSPNPSPPSIAGAFEPKRGGYEIEDAVERKAEYDEALQALGTAGRTAQIIVNGMAVFGSQCPLGGFGALLRGLRALRTNFELTDKSKSELVGN